MTSTAQFAAFWGGLAAAAAGGDAVLIDLAGQAAPNAVANNHQAHPGWGVLVPKVHLAQAGANALKPNGALITGDDIHIEGDSIVNRGGTIGGTGTQRAVLVASADIVIQGGTLKADQLGLQAGANIRNETLTW